MFGERLILYQSLLALLPPRSALVLIGGPEGAGEADASLSHLIGGLSPWEIHAGLRSADLEHVMVVLKSEGVFLRLPESLLKPCLTEAPNTNVTADNGDVDAAVRWLHRLLANVDAIYAPSDAQLHVLPSRPTAFPEVYRVLNADGAAVRGALLALAPAAAAQAAAAAADAANRTVVAPGVDVVVCTDGSAAAVAGQMVRVAATVADFEHLRETALECERLNQVCRRMWSTLKDSTVTSTVLAGVLETGNVNAVGLDGVKAEVGSCTTIVTIVVKGEYSAASCCFLAPKNAAPLLLAFSEGLGITGAGENAEIPGNIKEQCPLAVDMTIIFNSGAEAATVNVAGHATVCTEGVLLRAPGLWKGLSLTEYTLAVDQNGRICLASPDYDVIYVLKAERPWGNALQGWNHTMTPLSGVNASVTVENAILELVSKYSPPAPAPAPAPAPPAVPLHLVFGRCLAAAEMATILTSSIVCSGCRGRLVVVPAGAAGARAVIAVAKKLSEASALTQPSVTVLADTDSALGLYRLLSGAAVSSTFCEADPVTCVGGRIPCMHKAKTTFKVPSTCTTGILAPLADEETIESLRVFGSVSTSPAAAAAAAAARQGVVEPFPAWLRAFIPESGFTCITHNKLVSTKLTSEAALGFIKTYFRPAGPVCALIQCTDDHVMVYGESAFVVPPVVVPHLLGVTAAGAVSPLVAVGISATCENDINRLLEILTGSATEIVDDVPQTLSLAQVLASAPKKLANGYSNWKFTGSNYVHFDGDSSRIRPDACIFVRQAEAAGHTVSLPIDYVAWPAEE